MNPFAPPQHDVVPALGRVYSPTTVFWSAFVLLPIAILIMLLNAVRSGHSALEVILWPISLMAAAVVAELFYTDLSIIVGLATPPLLAGLSRYWFAEELSAQDRPLPGWHAVAFAAALLVVLGAGFQLWLSIAPSVEQVYSTY